MRITQCYLKLDNNEKAYSYAIKAFDNGRMSNVGSSRFFEVLHSLPESFLERKGRVMNGVLDIFKIIKSTGSGGNIIKLCFHSDKKKKFWEGFCHTVKIENPLKLVPHPGMKVKAIFLDIPGWGETPIYLRVLG